MLGPVERDGWANVEELQRLRRARDLMDREYARPLDVPAMSRVALMSPAHFSRRFTELVGITPSAYRALDHSAAARVPACYTKIATRPGRARAEQSRI